jgi:hypothetical protein
MGKAHKPSDSECYTQSSRHFRSYGFSPYDGSKSQDPCALDYE